MKLLKKMRRSVSQTFNSFKKLKNKKIKSKNYYVIFDEIGELTDKVKIFKRKTKK